MIGYVTIGVSDMEKGKAYWAGLLEPLGASVLMDIGRLALIGEGMEAPMIAVCIPFDENRCDRGNGNMIALVGGSREKVDELYARALELGGSDEGPPGERMPGFYAGYFRDPDGNKAAFFHMG